MSQKPTAQERLNYPSLDGKWIMPEWLKKYEKCLGGNGEPIEKLIRDFHQHGKNWAFSNIIMWAMCHELHGQILCLYRAHRAGLIA